MARKKTADLWERVDGVLDQIRPYIHSHGGDVNLVEIEGDTVRLQLVGACHGCPMSMLTLRLGIERIIQELVPEIRHVESVSPDEFEWPEIEPAGEDLPVG